MYKNQTLSIILPALNEEKSISNFIQELKKLNIFDEIIAVDNNSTDTSIKYVRKNYKDVIIVESSKNLGYSKGFNLGINKALSMNAEFLLITNNDIELSPSILQASINLFMKKDRIGYMSGKIFNMDREDTFQYAGGRLSFGKKIGKNSFCWNLLNFFNSSTDRCFF